MIFFRKSVFGVLGILLMSGTVQAQEVPLVAHYSLEPNGKILTDAGPLKLNGGVGDGTRFVPGKVGQALEFTRQGNSRAWVGTPGLIGRMGDRLTVMAWVKIENYADGGGLISKRRDNVAAPFALSIGKNGELGFEGNNGAGWENLFTGPNTAPKGEWFHLAFTYEAGGEARFFVNGKQVGAKKMSRALAANDQDFVLGSDPFRGPFKGALDEVKLFAVTLSPQQIQSEATGQTVPVRAAKENDFPVPSHLVQMALVRWDMPLGFREGYGRTRRAAQRVSGPDAVDWPQMTLDGKAIFEKSSEETRDLPLREKGQERPLFQQPYDQVVQPGNHWLRAVQWMWGQRYAYTTDRTARTWHNDYELWTFPILIKGNGDVKNVSLRYEGKEIYRNAGPLRSLTLLLPQNESGKKYELSLDGSAPIAFDVGLQAIIVGAPRERLIPLDLKIADGKFSVSNAPPHFANAKEWADDLQAMREAKAPNAALPATAFRQWPISIYAINPPHGMGGGAFFFGGEHLKKFEGSAAQYAEYVANLGIDFVFEKQWSDEYARALNEKGIRFGFIPGTSWGRPFIAHPNVAFFAANLPDYHAPLYRDLQLQAQRLKLYPNFAGLSTGADNAGYVSFWDWAPPIPNRPWGEAFVQFQQGRPLEVPLPKSLGGQSTVRQFLEYVARYDETFKQYGYFASAVREADPSLKFFTSSFGSSPGVGGRGGWPWATIPAAPMHENVDIMQAYDWNELSSSKPMHLVALLDRLKSHYPDKSAWALVDDFRLFFGREARQRAYALALTRGIEAIGTTFLAAPTGSEAKPQTIAEQRELFGWIHQHGGIYRGTRPLASIGVLYVHPQALLRRVNQDAQLSGEALLRGSHEGKTTEALWLSHAAGWPAKIVTSDELKRGLPAEMKVLLLTGLNRFDDSWAWFDGLENQLQAFVARGGKIILDDESVVPPGVDAQKADLKIASYVPQSSTDWTPILFARNRENIQKLRAVLEGIEKPVAFSEDATIWVVPHQTGAVQYVTIVNWGYDEEQNASQFVKPQIGKVRWNTARPIYNVKTGQKLTVQQAQNVDLTKDGFVIFALPQKDVANPQSLWSVSEQAPKKRVDSPLSTSLAKFAARKNVPLVIALTPEQQAETRIANLAKRVSNFYTKQGRKTEIRTLAPGEVVQSLQPLNLQKFPRWQTIEADLVLLGSAATNPLLFDQMRGGLLPEAALSVTYSPFVGEYQVLNVVAGDVAGLTSTVNRLMQ